jgi:hypothetical protein
MKYLVTLLAVLLTLGFIGTADAFHGGGVAHCDGCHSMHQSPENAISGVANSQLLKGTDPSSTCLNCHAGNGGYHIADETGLRNTNQGGDFGWIKKPYFVIVRGSVNWYGGDNAGHNIVATDFGYSADSQDAPGGTYSADSLGCTSCHDAHGQVHGGTSQGSLPIGVSGSYGGAVPAGTIAGNFRLLGDSSYEAPGSYNFTHDAPQAISRNCSSGGSYGCESRYGSGMSEWCANCHTQYINDNKKHVTSFDINGSLDAGTGIDANYNSYKATGDFTGSAATAYDELVPIEKGTVTTADLANSEGAMLGDENAVMCLTCHRAHASAHNNAGKWDFETEYIAESHAIDTTNLPATAAIYYASGASVDVATKYGHYQRSLCNKCHVQD